MGKKDKRITTNYNFDKSVYLYTLISIFIISLINRVKLVKGYLDFNGYTPLQGQTNIITYYKLIFLIVLVSVISIIFLYNRLLKKLPLRKDYVLIGTGLMIIALGIATALSDYPYVSIMGSYTRNNGLLAYIALFTLLYVVSNLKLENKQIKYTLYFVNTLSFIFTIVGIFEFFGHSLITSQFFSELVIPSIYKGATITSALALYDAGSLLMQPNYFGAYCAIFFPLITVHAISSDKLWDRIFFITGSLLLFAGINTAASMGGWVTVLVILVLLPLMVLNKKNLLSIVFLYIGYILLTVFFGKFNNTLLNETMGWINKFISSPLLVSIFIVLSIAVIVGRIYRKPFVKFEGKIAVAVILIVVILAAIGFVYVLDKVTPNNMSLFTNRGYVWHYSFEGLKSNFLFGYGPDNFPYKFPQDNPDTEKYSSQIAFDKPHNMYLQIVADGGIFALLGFLYLLVMLLIKSTKQIYEANEEINKNCIKAIFLTVVAYMIQGFVNDNHIGIQLMLYIVMGAGMSLVYYSEKTAMKNF